MKTQKALQMAVSALEDQRHKYAPEAFMAAKLQHTDPALEKSFEHYTELADAITTIKGMAESEGE